ncbi:MAG: Uma2 family endonuclease [Acidimicrobiales bacterium]
MAGTATSINSSLSSSVQLRGAAGLRCLGPVNIGNGNNYRVPDRSVVRVDAELGVFLPSAVMVVEIVSPDDETLAKFGFYFEHAVQEILVVDPASRSVAWFRRGAVEFVDAPGSEVVTGLDDLAGRLRWPT